MKTPTLLLIIALTLLPLATAAAPTLTNTIDLNGTATSWQMRIHEISDEYVALFDRQIGGSCRLRIVNTETGEITDENTFTCSYALDIDYDGGTFVTCSSYFVPLSGDQQSIRIYKWSEPGLLNYKGGWTTGTWASSFFGGCRIDKSSSTSADIFVGSFDRTSGGGLDSTGVAKIYFNGTKEWTDYPIIVPSSFNLLYDQSNDVFGTSNDFYDNTDPYNLTGKILDSLVNGDVLRAWNFDSGNPEWVSANGYVAIADDYSDIVETSGNAVMDDIVAMSGRENVIGLIDGWWHTADFSTTPGDPSLTNTSIKLTNYDPSPDARTYEFTTGQTKIYYYNETNDILTIWTYQAAPTCSASNGCYIDDSFTYSDRIANHGWSGNAPSLTPVNGELYCAPGLSRYFVYEYTPLLDDDAPFTLDFDLDICGDPLATASVTIGGNNKEAFTLIFQGDSLGGNIKDGFYNILSYSVGDEVDDPGNLTCSGLKRFNNHYTIVGNQDANPKTFDLYVNGAQISTGNFWTDEGQALTSTNFLYLSGSVVSPYCYWSFDNIKLYTDVPDTLDTTTEQSTIYGIDFSLGATDPFDEDKLCAPTENRGLCFLRVLFKGLLGSIWRAILNNPLETLALILVIAIIIATSVQGRRR